MGYEAGQALTTSGDQLRAALRRSRFLVLLCVIVGAAAGVALSQRAKPEYQSTATVLLSQVDLSSVVPGASLASTDPQRAVDTAVQLGESGGFSNRVEELVGQRLHQKDPSLPGSFQVNSNAGTDELTFTAQAHSAADAQLIAQTAASAFPGYRGEQLAAPLVQASTALEQTPGGGTRSTLQRIQILRQLIQSSASVVDNASGATATTPTPAKYGVIGGVSGLVVGLLLMALREALGGRSDAPEDIERALGARVLGSVPRRGKLKARRAGSNGAGTAVERLVVLLDAHRPESGEAVVCFLGASSSIKTGRIAAATVAELERRGEHAREVNFAAPPKAEPAQDGERVTLSAPTALRERGEDGWVVVEGPKYLESPATLELARVIDVAVLVTPSSMRQRDLRRIARELDTWPRRPYVAVLTVV